MLDAYEFFIKSTTSTQSYLNKTMQKVSVNNKFSALVGICSGVLQGSILGPLLCNIFIDILSFLTTCGMCNYADDNTLYIYSRGFHQVQEYLKTKFEILENWFYDNYMVLILVNVNSGAEEKPMKITFLPTMKSGLKNYH